jgi:WD40 repeat protein
MVGQPSERTFISYSRQDGAEYAAWLRTWLVERNLSVWQDIVALEGGQDWWSQIDKALRAEALQHFILVVTRAALDSPYVRDEIRLARQEGKTVCPVKGPNLGDLAALPRWLGQIYDLDLAEHQTTLVRVLQAESQPFRVQFRAPKLPDDFVQRPREFYALKARLLDPKGDPVAGIGAALRGAGGYGKTTLAMALANDRDIQDAYFDGILWIVLGERPNQLISIVLDQIVALTGKRPALETPNVAASEFAAALGNRSILIVVDDVWREGDLKPFLEGGPQCARLVTTRIDSVLPRTALRQPVDAMQASEALSLLSAGLPPDQLARERANLAKLAARLGEWAQLLKIVNGFLHDRVVRAHQPLSVAIAGANGRLDAKGLVVFDPRDESDRTRAVARTIGVSLELLSEPECARFSELGVFPEDAEINVGIARRLWEATGGLRDFETEDLLVRLFGLSLLLDLDLERRIFRLHDTVRHFLRDRAGKEGLLTHHQQVVVALDRIAKDEAAGPGPCHRYLHLYLPHHLAEAGERQRLDTLLLNPAWLQAKLEATSPQALVADYQRYGAGEAQSLIGRTLRLITGICTRDPSQLLPQLIGRLAPFEAAPLPTFVEAARALVSTPAIVPLRPGLIPPGAETARLEGHSSVVSALCLLPDGRLASGSVDNTIRLWDVATGAETARLEGHTDWVTALCVLPDGRLASGSDDKTIRLWNVATGAETARLEGHSSTVTALCLLPDGRLASGSGDDTIRLWDVATGAETARLEGHTDRVSALCLLPDGRLASGSHDKTIRLWNAATGAETARLEGHSSTVTALCLLPDGRLASGSSDNTIRLWNVATGAETARLELDAPVTAIIAVAPNRLVAGDSRGLLHWLEVAD